MFFGKILRKHEKKKKMVLNGASWVLISAALCVLTFPKTLMITGFTILIISDISAALIGRRYGRHDLFGKSVEGTSAFIISAFIVIIFYFSIFSAPWTYLVSGFVAAFIGGIVEAGSKRLEIDDNLSIPISVCLVMWAGNLFVEGTSLEFLHLIK
jgi:dolichol kinase